MGWTVATLEAIRKAGDYNRQSVRWTIAAVLFGTAATIVSLFPLSN